MKAKNYFKGLTAIVLSVLTILTTLPLTAFVMPTAATSNDSTSINLTLGDKLQYDRNINWSTHQMYADGRMAYCVNPKLPAPSGKYGSKNLTAVSEKSNTFAMLYKGLHYGYGGHGFNKKITAFGNKSMKQLMDKAKSDHWLGASGNSLYYLLTHRVLAKIYGDKDWKYALTSDWIEAVNDIEVKLKKAAKLKAEYSMYLLDPKNKQQKVIIMQDKLGGLEIIKDSSNHTLTDNSGCYSLKGAEFTVTNTKTKKTYTITANTKVNDGSATVKYKAILKNIVAGTYTVKETKAPKGYSLSKETKTVTVKAGTAKTSVTFKNPPQSDPVVILVKKTNGNGKAIAGAEFTVKFYKGYFTKKEIESDKAKSDFKRYWTFKSDDKGRVKFTKDYLVDSNNDFYYLNGLPTLPLGTITIQETKAPAGYVKDNTLYVQQITSNSSLTSVSTYNEFTNVNSPSTYYKIKKTSEDGVVAGVSFKIYEGSKVDEAKYLKTVKTGSNGEFKEKLDIGTYTFDEVVSDKYIKQEPVTVTIKAENTAKNPAVVSFKNVLNKGWLRLQKYASIIKHADGSTTQTIENVQFEIYDSTDKLVGTYTTGKNGLIYSAEYQEGHENDIELKPGTYRVHELPVPEYDEVADKTVVVKANQTSYVYFYNTAQEAKLKLSKTCVSSDGKDQTLSVTDSFTFKIESVGDTKFKPIEITLGGATKQSAWTIENNLPAGTYKVSEILTDKQKLYWEKIEEPKTVTLNRGDYKEVSFVNKEKSGNLKLVKTATDGVIKNVDFLVYGYTQSGRWLSGHLTTDENGEINEQMPFGEYQIEEFWVPSNHYYTKIYADTVTINGDKVVNVKNETGRKLKIVKTSETGQVEGFKFELSCAELGFSKIYTTDSKGLITTEDLKAGKYKVKEILSSDSPYVQPEEKTIDIAYPTTEKEYNTPISVSFNNELKKGSLEITKTAYDGFIDNVQFTLINNNDNSIEYHLSTDENGKAVFNDVLVGEYTLKEVNAGEQYIKIEDMHIVIEYNKTTTQAVENKPKDGYIKIVKTSDSQNLQGFEFEVVGTTWDNKKVRESYTTDENGLIVEKLPTGTYTVKEINAPNYFIQTQKTVLELTPYDTSDEPYTINIYNEYKRGSLKVIKSADDNFVENIKFNLSGTADCGEKVNITVTTNAEGCAEFNDVPIGTYNFSELTKEDRYVTVLDMEQTIEWNKVISVAVNNKLKTGEIQTTAHDAETGEHYAYANENTKIVDTVAYKDIAANQLYKLTGTIMNKETGEPLLVNNEKVVASKEFISSPTGAGTVDVEFSFNSADLVGKSIVVFEELSIKDKDNNDYVLAVHSNINDDGQTIIFNDPKIRTTAHDAVSNNNTAITDTATTIVDTVTYSDLIVEKEYTVAGTLMVKSSGKELTDSNGSPITASKTFTAENTDGSVEIEFTFDSSLLAGESVVAFEHLYYDGREIAVHTDINDGGQTVTFTEPPTEPPTEPTEPPTEPTVPPTEPTAPPTEPTVPPTEPTVPPTEPTVPTEPIEPTVPPTEPTVPTEPTEPPTEPTQPADSTVPPATEQTTVPGAGIDSNIPGAGIATGETDYLYIIAALCATLAFVIIIFAKKTNEK